MWKRGWGGRGYKIRESRRETQRRTPHMSKFSKSGQIKFIPMTVSESQLSDYGISANSVTNFVSKQARE